MSSLRLLRSLGPDIVGKLLAHHSPADPKTLQPLRYRSRMEISIQCFHRCSIFRKTEARILTQSTHNLEISTRGQGLYEFTSTVSEWVKRQKVQVGLLTIFCRHTSASLLIQENADPTVCGDIKSYFDRLAPENGPYDHNSEGPDDMPAHLKTALTQVQLSIPVVNGSLVLGTWQGIYLFEHRVRAHRREIVLHLIGE
jgi:secondary thiamine-phosphate synthase enzyme